MKYALIIMLILSLVSCEGLECNASGSFSGERTSVRVANWNTQTFFDAENDGSEYSEFVSSKKWGKEMYSQRLSRLCSVIRALDADVFVMEEIESENVVHDISNFLAGEWKQSKLYMESCFAKEDGSSIGCAVISRLPLSDFTVHGIYVHSDSGMPRMRPLMELTVKKGERELTLFVNHWKSMSGGEEETEVWRRRQESVLCRRMRECSARGKSSLALGDFNRTIEKFSLGENVGEILLMELRNGLPCGSVTVQSPWFRGDGSLVEPGSYVFRDEWSRIDNMFFCGEGGFLYFLPQTDGPWSDEETEAPLSYALWSGSGYSDHLPLLCEVWF